MHKKLHNFLMDLFLLLASLLICLLGTEVALRYFYPQCLVTHYPGIYMLDDILGYKLKPGWSGISSSPEYLHKITINSSGFYDDEFHGPNNKVLIKKEEKD